MVHESQYEAEEQRAEQQGTAAEIAAAAVEAEPDTLDDLNSSQAREANRLVWCFSPMNPSPMHSMSILKKMDREPQ